MIPKVIHYCWFNPDQNKPLPEVVRHCITSWQRLLPDYQIILWNEDNFDLNSVIFTRQAYDTCKFAYVSDYVRLWVIYNYGGIYLDADVEILQRFDHLLSEPAFIGLENPISLGTAIIGAEPKNPLIKYLLDHYTVKTLINSDGSTDVTLNNSVFNDLFRSYGINLTDELQRLTDITIYPKSLFYPHNRNFINSQTLFIHHLMVSHIKQISVVMSIHNEELYIRECMESILDQTFTNFELIIVDDGSTDLSANIIKSYHDDRIVYIYKKHSGVTDSLNLGIKRATGKYIARMDADDIMLPDRLEEQYKYMEDHPHIDVLGAGIEYFSRNGSNGFFKANGRVTLETLRAGNQLAHPTVIFKADIADGHSLYSNEYPHAEDYHLWVSLTQKGKHIENIPKIVLKYRQHNQQVSTQHAKLQMESTLRIQSEVLLPSLTVIIGFKNEKEEIERTVRSIRNTTVNVSILLIDDASDDSFDYQFIARKYSCQYARSAKSLGVAGARNYGVHLCKTPYFVIIDGHMRFYDQNWDKELVKQLSDHPQAIICSNTVIIQKDKNGVYDNEDGAKGRDSFGTHGAYINFEEPGWEFSAKWTAKSLSKEPVKPIPCVLGAVYASSVNWWKKIQGLHGLQVYGADEPLMSIKTWLAGGEVLIMDHWGVGHLYRSNKPYKSLFWHEVYNQLFLIALLAKPNQQQQLFNNYAERTGEQFQQAYREYIKNKAEIEAHRSFLEKYVFIKTLEEYQQFNQQFI